MLLKSLEISGFKSFAKKTTLEFSAPISAIVGPNGSGKSNVAEAFRFVLGEQSIKSLRGKRGEDLIFNGGKNMARQNRASVKLIFDNKAKIFPIDFDEIIIERVVHRDSVNEYILNGSQVRLKDITELLFSAHIGTSGHHIISQGEADRLLTASIKERRGMLEEALGLRAYQVKKEESERKLGRTSENIREVESLRREIAPHIRFLKKQVEKYERSIALREELKDLYILYFKNENKYVKTEIARITDEKKIPENTMSVIVNQIKEIKETLSRKEENKNQHQKETEEIIALQIKVADTRFKKEELVRNSGKLEAEISYIDKSIRDEEAKSHQDTQKVIQLSEVNTLKNTIDEYAREVGTIDDVSILRTVIKNIKDSLSRFIENHVVNTEAWDEKKKVLVKERAEKIVKKTEIENKILEFTNEESKTREREQEIKTEMEKKKDDTFEAEKKMLELMGKEQEIANVLNILRLSEEKIRMLDEEFKSDLHEAGMLIGVEVLKYKDIVDGHLQIDLQTESRHLQIERRKDIEHKKIRLEEIGGGNGSDVMKEYTEVTERDQFLEKELGDLGHSSSSLQILISELEEKIDTEFREGVEKINKEFSNFFVLMFGGGNASLKLVKEAKRKLIDEEEGDESVDDAHLHAELLHARAKDFRNGEEEEVEKEKEGIEIDVALPHKKTKGLVMLSGGERALTSIALLFAISQVNPPPFIILDETDAALDEANSKKYGDMIERLSSHSGLILITHNRETMSRAGIIYGVTMGGEGISKLLSIQFEEAVVVAK